VDSKPDRQLLAGAVALALSAAGLYVATGLNPVWWLVWLAPAPAVAFAHRARPLAAFAVCFGAWLLGGLNLYGYLVDTVRVPIPVVLVVLVVPALVFAAAVMLSRAVAAAGRPVAAVLALPAAWVTAEYLISVASPHGTFASLAYTQADFLLALQLASASGLWGIDFAVLLIPSALAVLLAPRVAAGDRRRVGATALLLLATAAGYGASRLATAPSPASSVTVGVAAADEPASPKPASDEPARRALDAYAREVDALGAAGARLAVLPETIVEVPDAGLGDVARPFEEASRRHGMVVVVGLDLVGEQTETNAAIAFAPDGTRASYAKQRLIPGLEDQYRPGTGPTVVGDSAARWGVAVCKDMDFPSIGRQYGVRGVALLAVPAWDFGRDGWLHSRMAVVRGVEGGFAVARSARNGLLTVSDNRGRVVAESASDSAAVASLVATVPLEPAGTLYLWLGDWFAWLCAAGVAAALASRFARAAPAS
jgi:apolipoprotein N-acyltransferase